MKYHVFWFPEYYPAGGTNDYAGAVEAGSLEEVRAFILSEFEKIDRDLEEYQITDENLTVVETGALVERYLNGGKRAPKTIEPHDEPHVRFFSAGFPSRGAKG